MFKEYPKCLYLGGAVDAVFCVVLDSIEEKQARADGHLSVGESQEKAKTKPTEKVKK